MSKSVDVNDLSGAALDWAVLKCERPNLHPEGTLHTVPVYSSDWAQAGPIIEREDISFRKYHRPDSAAHGTYYAKICRESGRLIAWSKERDYVGATPLEAAMRCYVASKLGDTIDVPDELIGK